jgi:hypothetical protein
MGKFLPRLFTFLLLFVCVQTVLAQNPAATNGSSRFTRDRISSQFSHQKCNIEIALIDNEVQMAIDVFYLTSGGFKLTVEHQKCMKSQWA